MTYDPEESDRNAALVARWNARMAERDAKRRAAKEESVKRALAAVGWAALRGDPLTPARLVDALESEEWERGCRCYPAEED